MSTEPRLGGYTRAEVRLIMANDMATLAAGRGQTRARAQAESVTFIVAHAPPIMVKERRGRDEWSIEVERFLSEIPGLWR